MDWKQITVLFFITFLSYFTGSETQRRLLCPRLKGTNALLSRNFQNVTCKQRAITKTCKISCTKGFIMKKKETEQEMNYATITCRNKSAGVPEWDGWERCVAKLDNEIETSLSTTSTPRATTTKTTPKPCTPTPPGLAGRHISRVQCENTAPRSTCKVTCQPGYKAAGEILNQNVRCLGGTWRPRLLKTCSEITCPSRFPNQLRTASNSKCNKSINGSCEVHCQQGFEDQVSPTTIITCNLSNSKLSGIWAGYEGKTCTPKNCKLSQSITDATDNCSNVPYRSSCQIQCNDGHEFSAGMSTKMMSCRLNPTKTSQVVLEPTPVEKCRRKTCAPLQLHSPLIGGKCSDKPFDSSCEVQCGKGYKFPSGDSTKLIRCSLINSQPVWQPAIEKIETCQMIQCPLITETSLGTPPAGAHLPQGYSKCNITSGSTCSLSCQEGYAFGNAIGLHVSIRCDDTTENWIPPLQDVRFCTVKIVGNDKCEYWSSGTMVSGTVNAEKDCKRLLGESSTLAMPKTRTEKDYAGSLRYLVGAFNGNDSWRDGDDINAEIRGEGNCVVLAKKTLVAYDCSNPQYFMCERPTALHNTCLSNPCKSEGICTPYGCSFRCKCKANFFGHICEKGPFDIIIETSKTLVGRETSVRISYGVRSNAGKAKFTLYVNGEKQGELYDIRTRWKNGTYTAKMVIYDIYISGKAFLEAQPDNPVYECKKVTVRNADESVNITKDVCNGTFFDITWKGLGTNATSSIPYDIYLDDELQGSSSSTRYKLQGLTTATDYDIRVIPQLPGCSNKILYKVHKQRTSRGPPNPSTVHLPDSIDRSLSNCTITWSNDRTHSISGFKIYITEKMKGYKSEFAASTQSFFERDVDGMEYVYPTNPNSIYEVLVGTKPLSICRDVPVWSNRTLGCRTDSSSPKEVRVPMTVVPNSEGGTVSMEISSVDERNGQVSCYLVIVQKTDPSASENSTSGPITNINKFVQANQTIRDGDSFVTLALPRFEGNTNLILGDDRMTCCDMSISSRNCDQERPRRRRAVDTIVRGENHQLDPDASYRHYIVVSTPTASGDYVLIASAMSDPWSPDDRNNNALAIALPVIFVILFVLVVVAIIIVRRKNTKSKVHAVPMDHALMPVHRRPTQDEAVIDVNPDDIVNRYLSAHSFQLANLHKTMENKRADEEVLFLEEFKGDINKMIAQCQLTSDMSQLPENRSKNRYKNIVPYDSSRVVLEKTPGNEFSDYINATYIDGYKRTRKFIATQGPQPQTIGDFWRMVWEQECYIITILTNLVEQKKVKCAQYWPEEEATSKKYDSINVTFKEITTYGDYVRRKFEVSRDGKTRIIFQFHFIAWPDHGIPNTTSSILRFHKSVIYSQPSFGGPIVVHCSAGVGRTGTFIALDILSEQISEEKGINICALVGKMRTNRPEMVQTLDQYIYIHKLVLELYQFGETDVEVSAFSAAYNNLRRINGQRSEIEQEFEMLDYFLPLDTDHETAQRQINKHLNRNSAVLPYDRNAVFIQMIPTDRSVPYYNASEIASYHANDKFIAAQTPDEDSIEMFWRTVFDNNVSMIVSLCETKEEANYCYWPERSEVMKHGSVSVITIEEASDMGCVERKFEVTNKDQKIYVSQIFYGNWAENVVPASSGILLEIIARVEKHHQTLGNSEKKTTLVHCRDGSGRSGTFCAISNLIERLKNENRVDVFRTVKDLRDQRSKMVQSLAQYDFSYQAVNEFLQSFDLYGNFQ